MERNGSEASIRRGHTGRISRFVLAAALCALVLLPSPRAIYGQVLYGSLTGSITDPSQAAVPGAAVQLVNVGTGVMKEAKSNESGIYLFNDLQPGFYRLTITAPSFSTITSENLVIEANRVRRFDAILKLAQVTESVTVSTGAEMLQTDRSDVNVNVTGRQITSLTLGGSMGRNYQSLMAVVPGTVAGCRRRNSARRTCSVPFRSMSMEFLGSRTIPSWMARASYTPGCRPTPPMCLRARQSRRSISLRTRSMPNRGWPAVPPST